MATVIAFPSSTPAVSQPSPHRDAAWAAAPFHYVTDDDGAVAVYLLGQAGRDIAPLLLMPVGDGLELTACEPLGSRELGHFPSFRDALDIAKARLLRLSNPRQRLTLAPIADCA